jgi:hypothetical protein
MLKQIVHIYRYYSASKDYDGCLSRVPVGLMADKDAWGRLSLTSDFPIPTIISPIIFIIA